MENQADKSQEATPYKLAEARKKGQVGKSMEFVSISSLIVMLMALILMLPSLGESLVNDFSFWLKNVNQMVESPALIGMHLKKFTSDFVKLLGAVVACGIAATVIFSILHAGVVFSFFPLKLDFEKLNPVNGLKKIFSGKGLFEIFKVTLKLIFIAGAILFIWGQIKGDVLHIKSFSLYAVLDTWKSSFVVVVLTFSLLFFIFALFDLWYSKRDFAKKMRMSTRDVKDEYKRREGDPEIKNKRKRNMQNLIKNVMGLSGLKNADVVVTNPTHVAVALQYRANSMALPKVVVKGKGFLAKIIMKKAYGYGIPVMRVPKLARTIYKECEINNPIPIEEQYTVAKIYQSLVKMPGTKVYS